MAAPPSTSRRRAALLRGIIILIMEYEAIIGLEVHAQLLTKSKIFCGCSTEFGAPPNTNTCPVCLGLPGALPVLNRAAVEMAIKAALALGCEINLNSIFARKNYFYPDLPKGYQISQYELPLSHSGRVELLVGERSESGNIVRRFKKQFRIRRLHLEEDAGKLIHGADGRSFIDYNRSGVPLIEIVSEPDLRTSQEAHDYLAHLRKTLMYIGVCAGNMEEGNLRCDANVSVRPRGSEELGTKVEIKNLNSFRFLQRALDYEIKRQIEVLESGGRLVQETRLWNEAEGKTFPMRSKEEAHDYRYFPEPDLLPLSVTAEWVEKIRSELPELPEARRQRFVAAYGLSDEDSLTLTATRELADYYEATALSSGNPRAAANWIMSELTYSLREAGLDIGQSPIRPEELAALIRMIDSGEISSKMGKMIFSEMFSSGQSAQAVVERLGLKQISDVAEIERLARQIIAANPNEAAQYRAGKERVLGFFVGQIMKATRGQANPQLVNEILKRELSG